MVKREQDTAVNLPFGEGEKRKLSVAAGRTGRARSPCRGQPAWQLLAPLDYVQCETLSWSFSTIAAPGWDGHWQSASSWVLLGASGLFVDRTAIGWNQLSRVFVSPAPMKIEDPGLFASSQFLGLVRTASDLI